MANFITRTTRRRLLASLFSLSILGGTAQAATIYYDLSGVFNADVIINREGTGLDPTQQPIDRGSTSADNFAMLTQSAAQFLSPSSGNGLPDNGQFAANADHPLVLLQYSDSDSGDNARRSPGADTYSFNVPQMVYSNVHVFATTGDGTATMQVVLNYTDLTTSAVSLVVPDWFANTTASSYFLIDGMDRAQRGAGPGTPFAFEDNNAAAIFGFPILANGGKVLSSLTISRTDTTGAVLNVFGALGQPVPEPGTLTLLMTGGAVAVRRWRRRHSPRRDAVEPR